MATAQANARTKTAANETSAKSDDIEAQLEALRADLAALADSVSGLGQSKAGDLKQRGEEVAAKIAENSSAAVKRVKNDLDRIEKNVSTGVRAKPIRSIAIAAGLGLAVGYLVRR
ncbi:DUF883 C-terminal domain-containing protein [Nisaea sp.]|uniref:DUF883 C-terminal domain-containing protein n=1 Tax=Nisaea sp. TaxID=2024842 RepID=UPI0032641D33